MPTRSSGSATPRTSPPLPHSCAATRRPTSPARPSTSMVARRSDNTLKSRSTRVALSGSHGPLCHAVGMPTRSPVVRGSSPRSTRLVAVAAAFALSLTLAACGDDEDARKPDSQPVEGGAQLAALWPLTGERVNGSTPKHPVLVAKIDNTASSKPQVGLKKADLVTEELVEGGMTRLAVFFYRHLPEVAGPVRSMRASDIGIVKPAHAVIAASGAA